MEANVFNNKKNKQKNKTMVLAAWLCILLHTTWCGFGPKTCDAEKQAAETCAGWRVSKGKRRAVDQAPTRPAKKHPVSHDHNRSKAKPSRDCQEGFYGTKC